MDENGDVAMADATTLHDATAPTAATANDAAATANDDNNLLGLHALIQQTVMACDVDVRPNLLNNIIVTGAASLTDGLTDRLNLALRTLMPSVRP